jgi:DNA-binding NtrC family response regulator
LIEKQKNIDVSAEKQKILVVDDEITILRLLKINLTKNKNESRTINIMPVK